MKVILTAIAQTTIKAVKSVINTVLYTFLAASAITGAFVIGCGIGVWFKLAGLTIYWYKGH